VIEFSQLRIESSGWLLGGEISVSHEGPRCAWAPTVCLSGCSPPPPPPAPKAKLKKKHTDFVDMMVSKVLLDLRFSLNQGLKSTDD
jgi:hypothetical protein